jgi:hypothetical protein
VLARLLPVGVVSQRQRVLEVHHERCERVGLAEDAGLVARLERRDQPSLALEDQPGQAPRPQRLVTEARLERALAPGQIEERERQQPVEGEAAFGPLVGRRRVGVRRQRRQLQAVVLVERLERVRQRVDRLQERGLVGDRPPGPRRRARKQHRQGQRPEDQPRVS